MRHIVFCFQGFHLVSPIFSNVCMPCAHAHLLYTWFIQTSPCTNCVYLINSLILANIFPSFIFITLVLEHLKSLSWSRWALHLFIHILLSHFLLSHRVLSCSSLPIICFESVNIFPKSFPLSIEQSAIPWAWLWRLSKVSSVGGHFSWLQSLQIILISSFLKLFSIYI